MSQFAEKLMHILPPHLKVSREIAEKLASHWQLVWLVNQSLNLTAIREEEAALEKHYLDSLLLLEQIPCASRLLDVGSGAGFPGMVLAIARPDLRVYLLEATAKRCAFMRQSADKLGISNVDIIEARAEMAAHDPSLRESFDIVTARAVTALPALCEYCLPFLRVEGLFLAMKGPSYQEELAEAAYALEILGGKYLGLQAQTLPCGDERRILSIEKSKKTPPKYPRREGIPEKRPL